MLAGLVKQRVLVTLTNDQGLEGVMWAADASGVLLVPSGPEPILFYPAGAEVEEIDRGQVFTPMEQVKFVQLLGREGPVG